MFFYRAQKEYDFMYKLKQEQQLIDQDKVRNNVCTVKYFWQNLPISLYFYILNS